MTWPAPTSGYAQDLCDETLETREARIGECDVGTAKRSRQMARDDPRAAVRGLNRGVDFQPPVVRTIGLADLWYSDPFGRVEEALPRRDPTGGGETHSGESEVIAGRPIDRALQRGFMTTDAGQYPRRTEGGPPGDVRSELATAWALPGGCGSRRRRLAAAASDRSSDRAFLRGSEHVVCVARTFDRRHRARPNMMTAGRCTHPGLPGAPPPAWSRCQSGS
jgi:hypothetical protein